MKNPEQIATEIMREFSAMSGARGFDGREGLLTAHEVNSILNNSVKVKSLPMSNRRQSAYHNRGRAEQLQKAYHHSSTAQDVTDTERCEKTSEMGLAETVWHKCQPDKDLAKQVYDILTKGK